MNIIREHIKTKILLTIKKFLEDGATHIKTTMGQEWWLVTAWKTGKVIGSTKVEFSNEDTK